MSARQIQTSTTTGSPQAQIKALLALLGNESERYEHAPPKMETSPSILTRHMKSVPHGVVPSPADLAARAIQMAWNNYALQPTAYLHV